MATHVIAIPDWQPATYNRLHAGGHWAARHRLKRVDREFVGVFARLAGVPRAAGRRRVSLRVVLAPGRRAPDPDAYWKSLLDALVAARLLVDDNRQNVELGPVTFGRAAAPRTEIVLEDLE